MRRPPTNVAMWKTIFKIDYVFQNSQKKMDFECSQHNEMVNTPDHGFAHYPDLTLFTFYCI